MHGLLFGVWRSCCLVYVCDACVLMRVVLLRVTYMVRFGVWHAMFGVPCVSRDVRGVLYGSCCVLRLVWGFGVCCVVYVVYYVLFVMYGVACGVSCLFVVVRYVSDVV